MWLAATETTSSTGSNELIVAVFVFLGVVVTAAGGVIVALVNSRTDRTAPSPPAPVPLPVTGDLGDVRERVRVLEYRADDKDDQDEVQDRRLDQIEDVLDTDNPRWKHLNERRRLRSEE